MNTEDPANNQISVKICSENQHLDYANQDALTKLPNRFWLMNYLRTYVNDMPSINIGMALLFVDLNDFRNIKYAFGHVFSDELLCQFGARLSSLLNSGDYVARLSYGEFAVLMNNANELNDVRKMAEQIFVSLSLPFELSGGRRHSMQASIGISLYPQDANNGETILKFADIAMYAARADGGLTYRFYQPLMSSLILKKITMDQALRLALERNEFTLFYQPKVDCISGQLRGFEALLRWNHPELGLVNPNDFIPVAEESGLIVQLGEHVIELVCAQIAAWTHLNIPLFPISINVSPQQLNREDLSAKILHHTAVNQVDPAMLEIEVTESCIVKYDLVAKQQFASLSALGIKLLLDDFGTGYSSLSQLQQYQMDVLKVDRAFTANLRPGDKSIALVNAIISMAHALGMTVVAEGVETSEQLHLLRTLLCDEVQGYLISKPVTADAISNLVRKKYLIGSNF